MGCRQAAVELGKNIQYRAKVTIEKIDRGQRLESTKTKLNASPSNHATTTGPAVCGLTTSASVTIHTRRRRQGVGPTDSTLSQRMV